MVLTKVYDAAVCWCAPCPMCLVFRPGQHGNQYIRASYGAYESGRTMLHFAGAAVLASLGGRQAFEIVDLLACLPTCLPASAPALLVFMVLFL